LSTAERRARERAQRRREILDAARQEFLESGVGRPTMDDIASRAEVSKGTIYLYFKSKEEILAHLLLEGLDLLIGQMRAAVAAIPESGPADALRSLAFAYLRFSVSSPLYFRLIMGLDRGRFEESIPRRLHQQVVKKSLLGLDLVAEQVRRGAVTGAFHVDDPWRAAGSVWAALNGVLVLMAHPLRQRMLRSSVEGMFGATLDLVLKGLGDGQSQPQTEPRQDEEEEAA
jgi:AcrR family transcriptional regulator